MKHLKKFENFYLSPDVDSDEQEFLDYSRNLRNMKPSENEEEFCEPCEDDEINQPEPGEITPNGEDDFSMDMDMYSSDEEEGDFSDMYDSSEEEEGEFPGGHIMKFDESKKSYKKGSKKSKPDFLDIDKDGDKKETMKKAAKDAKDSKGDKGLTAAQKKLPEGLRKAIEARKKK